MTGKAIPSRTTPTPTRGRPGVPVCSRPHTRTESAICGAVQDVRPVDAGDNSRFALLARQSACILSPPGPWRPNGAAQGAGVVHRARPPAPAYTPLGALRGPGGIRGRLWRKNRFKASPWTENRASSHRGRTHGDMTDAFPGSLTPQETRSALRTCLEASGGLHPFKAML
jgi:hypothetical protein